MAHYAFIRNNQVFEVITGIDEDDTSTLPEEFNSWEEFYLSLRPSAELCKRTSYNTVGNQHLLGGVAFRGNFASIDYSYDPDNDVFIPPKPYPSFILNESTWNWEAPVDKPDDGNLYVWNENQQNWELQNLS